MTLSNGLIARVFGIIVLILGLAVPAQGNATEIALSKVPIANILPLIVSESNHDDRDSSVELQFSVVNDTAVPVIWRLRSKVLNPLSFEVHSEGADGPIFASPFRWRPQLSHASQGPVLLSAPLTLLPGERMRLRASFERMPGPDIFPISLMSEAQSDAMGRGNAVAHGIYFGAMLAFVIVFLFSANAIASVASKWFGFYLVALTLLNAHSHGYLLSLLHLSAEDYFPGIRLLQAAIMSTYLTFAMSFLDASTRYPVLARVTQIFIFFILTSAPVEIASDSAQFRLAVDALAIIFLALGVTAAYLALRDGRPGGGFFAAGFALLLVVGGVNYIASIPSFAPWNEIVDRVTLALQSCDALVFGAAIFGQIYGLRRQRDEAVEEKLDEFRQKLEVSQKLRSSEQNLHRARLLAERHRESMASTSHDLRQPLASLRMTLERAREVSPTMAADFSTGLEFLDGVLSDSLAKSRVDAEGVEDQPTSTSSEAAEAVALQIVFENVRRMFAAEAEQRGLALKIVPTSLSVEVRTIDLVRIASNLVANAIRYTETGGVLLGARRRGETVSIEAWDTGPGIEERALSEIMQPYRRGADVESAGEGLGLSIVQRLIIENGLYLSVRSEVGRGSRFAVTGLRRADGI